MPALSIESIADGLQRTRGAQVDIAFRIRGSGPAIVLLHGTSASHAVWEPISLALEAVATVITLDQRGHGRSDRPPAGYTGPDFVADVVTVLDALGIDRAIVGGHSLGARNAWLAGALYPGRTRAVLAVDYTPWVEPEVIDVLQARVAGGNRAFVSVHDIEAYLQDRYRLLPADAVARRAEWGYARGADGLWRPLAAPAAMDQLIQGFRTRWVDEFEAVTVPMVQMRGAHSGIVSDEAWRAAVESRPQDRVVVDAAADHYLPEEHPALVTAELQRLLAQDPPR